MSRIRSIHPGFFTDERLVSTSMAARMLFIGLGVEADDKGIFEWKPLTIKMRVFPADNVDVSELLAELEDADAVKSYEIDGRKYGAIRNFRKFQKPKTPNDIHPMPDDFRNYVGLPAPVSEPFPQKGEKSVQMEDGGGKRERKEEPDGSSKKRGSRWASGEPIPKPWVDWAKQAFPRIPELRILEEGRKFSDYWAGTGATKADWQATWRNWMRKAFPDQERPIGEVRDDLVVIREGSADWQAVETLRGKDLISGKSGTTTVTKQELERARRATQAA